MAISLNAGESAIAAGSTSDLLSNVPLVVKNLMEE
jgi:hypothetical protein